MEYKLWEPMPPAFGEASPEVAILGGTVFLVIIVLSFMAAAWVTVRPSDLEDDQDDETTLDRMHGELKTFVRQYKKCRAAFGIFASQFDDLDGFAWFIANLFIWTYVLDPHHRTVFEYLF